MEENVTARFIVGIDLGTTHSVLSYLDLEDEDSPQGSVFPVPQLVSPGAVESAPQLPSFLYLHHESELAEGDLTLPWAQSEPRIVGELARSMGAKTPIRLVSSAKSWLCHGGVDRKSGILPLDAPEEVTKVSPYFAAQQYLEHLKSSWDTQFPEHPLAQQKVVLTIPASFDPAARELTAQAAQSLGLTQLTLLEEPQSAVYSWIQSQGEQWREQLSVGDVVLVVDVGGGTTDLSLVAVTDNGGDLELNRVAVGDHILLGGDNMDLALAYRINAKLNQEGKQLQPWQIQALTHACRAAKETLLVASDVDSVPITVPSRGSKLLGATLRSELTREEVEQTIVEGFFPQVGINEKPMTQPRGALTQMGLPYAQDAAVTRHLAGFLSKQSESVNSLPGFETATDFIKPTAILLNGGVLKAPLLAERLLSVINGWLQSAGSETARLLDGADLDLSVAKGAAYFGFGAEDGRQGVRIRGGIANTYYVGIESAMPAVPGMPPPVQALCVAPFGMEEGASVQLDQREFGLVVGEPVYFKFFGSNSRREDAVGTLLDFWQPDELEALPDIQATLTSSEKDPGEVVAVTLAASVTEVGTLKLEALEKNGEGRWNVELMVRD